MTETAEAPLLLTLRQVYERLGMGKTFVENHYIKTGRLTVIRVGKSGSLVRINAREVDTLVMELTWEAQASSNRSIENQMKQETGKG